MSSTGGSAMSRIIAVAAVLACGGCGDLFAHGNHARLHEVEVRTTLTVEPVRILLTHEETFTTGMSRFVCTEIDRNSDTRLSSAEIEEWSRRLARQIPQRCPLEIDWLKVAPREITQHVRGVPATVPATDTAAPPVVFRMDAIYPLDIRPGSHMLDLLLGTTSAYTCRTDLVFVPPVRALNSHAGEVAPAGARISNYIQIDGQPRSVACVFESGAPRTGQGVRPELAAMLGVALFALGSVAGRRRAFRDRR